MCDEAEVGGGGGVGKKKDRKGEGGIVWRG